MRSRPSKIEQAPDELLPALQEAFDALLLRKETQTAILVRLNEAAAGLGLDPFSASALGRYSQRVVGGTIGRPGSPPSPSCGDGIFTPSFRESLRMAVGDIALVRIESAMSALGGTAREAAPVLGHAAAFSNGYQSGNPLSGGIQGGLGGYGAVSGYLEKWFPEMSASHTAAPMH